MSPTWILAIILAFSIAANVGEGWVIRGDQVTIAAKDTVIKDVTKDRDAQVAGLETAKESLRRQQEVWDADQAKTLKTAAVQQQAITDIATKLQDASEDRDTYLQQLKDQAHARPATILVSGPQAPEGWDSLVVAGMRRLRCVQLADSRHQSAADCRIPAEVHSGLAGASGDPAGAGAARPSADQQLDFLAFAWRLRDWGASCYADKAAIRASQKAGDVAP